jgi:4-diphosphocytidyl-2-C-methyl-D-erythritol kinase
MIIIELAPAKINLTLEVLGKRPDGYHEIASLVAFANDVHDIIALDTTAPVGVSVDGPFAGSIAGENLILYTLDKLSAANAQLQLGAVRLTKNLPVAAGIGGGSADSAAVLRAVQRANADMQNQVDWLAIAKSIGADVPVCFENRSLWMTGIGDVLHPVAELPWLTGVLVNPLQPMPSDKTARVFRALNAPALKYPDYAAPPPGPFGVAHALVDYMKSYGNALDRPASEVAPVIADIKRAIGSLADCKYVAVSGAGPTCFGIFTDASKATAKLQQDHPNWWVQPVTLR